ncbi:MAG: YdiU family protein [Myxococcota bacterium]
MPAPTFDNTYRRLPDDFYASVSAQPAPEPSLVHLNTQLAAEVGLDAEWLRSEAGVAMLAGAAMPAEAEPIAMVYAGHQFGGWAPRLGDGRAALIGEVVNAAGDRLDLHLKGSGRTPYSRGGDGKAVLGPVMREYIVAEAMAALGVPTTRSLAVTTTGERVIRDGPEPGAVLARLAHSHVRVGTFQYFLGQERPGRIRQLADYVIARHYPALADESNPYRSLFEAVCQRQVELVAQWMGLGFIHGVMNTDNMQIAGETIDYGPCAFMDTFHPLKVFSSIDRGGRYAYGNQPTIAIWNLTRLAECLLDLFAPAEDVAIAWVEEALARAQSHFGTVFSRRFQRKLGLVTEGIEGHDELVETTFSALTEGKVDFTLFFRRLTDLVQGGGEASLIELFEERTVAEGWLERWRAQAEREPEPLEARLEAMKTHNPIFIPRNHRVEEAIVAGNRGDFGPFRRLVEVLQQPFIEQREHADLEAPPRPEEVVHQTFCGT